MLPPLPHLILERKSIMKTVEQILAEVKEKNIELIRFLYTDNDSVIRGYTTTGSELESDLMTGHSYTKGMAFFSALDILGPDTKYACEK